MVHLLPLPGSPRPRPMSEILDRALGDAGHLIDAGFDGIVVENFGDMPFDKDRVAPITVAAMTRVVAALVELASGKANLCVNVLRNDARSALAIAAVSGAKALRVNIHSGVRVTDQGVVEGRAAETLRLRSQWGAADVGIWADVAVKHSAPLGQERPLAEEVEELVGRAGADAVIVTGTSTGNDVDRRVLQEVSGLLHGKAPVLVGSGASRETVADLLALAHGVIVGTSLKKGRRTEEPIDLEAARAFVDAAN